MGGRLRRPWIRPPKSYLKFPWGRPPEYERSGPNRVESLEVVPPGITIGKVTPDLESEPKPPSPRRFKQRRTHEVESSPSSTKVMDDIDIRNLERNEES